MEDSLVEDSLVEDRVRWRIVWWRIGLDGGGLFAVAPSEGNSRNEKENGT